MAEFSHYSEDGSITMVDVSNKKETSRLARASGFIKMNVETIDLIKKNLLPKGNPFEIAKVAGIMAGKRTNEMIPLCHGLQISYLNVNCEINDKEGAVEITSEVRLIGKTGAEMEALTAVSVAALTIYDMCKAVDKNMVIGNIKLIEKKGGKSDFEIDQ